MNSDLQCAIDNANSRLYYWLESWCQDTGAFNGFVVHRFDLKRLKMIHDTPWGHCAVIEGLIFLYEKNKDEKIRSKIEEAVLLQISRLNEDGSFINAGFEDDRFSSLVHNSMADRALLAYYHFSGAHENTKRIALETVKNNVNRYLIDTLWNDEINAFKFSKIDYYSLKKDRYVANMNCVAIEVLIDLASITCESKYLNYAKRCGEWLKTQSIKDSNPLRCGGISYGSTNPQNLVSIYTALCLPGLCRLYESFNDIEYKKIALKATENLLRFVDNSFFCHSMEGNKELRYPYFIAGSGIILYGINEVNESFGTNYTLDLFIQNLIRYQRSNGGFENFRYYNSESNNRIKARCSIRTWEDAVPCLPWNAQLFRFFSKISSGTILVRPNNNTFEINKSFIYYEGKKKMFVFSWFPARSIAALYINKQKSVSIVSFSLKEIISKIRNKRVK